MNSTKTSKPISRPGFVKSISSVSNPEIKVIRGLITQRKHRRESGLFVAEGLKLAIDALTANWEVLTLVYSKDVASDEPVKKIASQIHARGGSLIEVTQSVLSSMTRRDNPQMVVGVFKQRFTNLNQIHFSDESIWIGLEQIRDPGNLGTIIRTADAVGISGIVLVGDSTDPFSVEAVRASMGSIFHVPLTKCSTDQFISWTKKIPVGVFGTHLQGNLDYRKVEYDQSCLLLMGSEQSGLSGKLVDICDKVVRIPQSGTADSLNLAVATGVMLYEVCRKKLVL